MCVCVCVVSPHSLHTSNPTLPSQTHSHYSDSATQPDGPPSKRSLFDFCSRGELMVRVRAAASRSGLACGRLLFDGWVGKAERPVALRLHDDEPQPSPCFQGKSKTVTSGSRPAY